MPSDGGGEVFSFFVEKLDLGDAASAAPGVGGNDVCRPGSLGELANLLGRVEHLVGEDGEVERQPRRIGCVGCISCFFSSVLTDSILYKVWNMVRCFLRGPFEFKRRNHICLEIIPAKAKSLLISLCHFDLFKNFGSFLEAQSSSGLER